MTTLLPSHLKTHIASQLKESITESSNTAYYVFAGKHTAYANGSIPTPVDSYQTTLYDAYNNMVFGKRVSNSDVSLLIPRVEWSANVIYNSYDSSEVVVNTNFYVAVQGTAQHDVFKVIDNNDQTPSLVAPNVAETSPSDEFYQTSDGYVWKYMYSVANTVWDKFVTDDYMPVGSNTQVEGNAVSGAIDRIKIVERGSNYNAVLDGQFTADQIQIGGNPLFYVIDSSASPNNDFYTDSNIYITSGSGAGQFKKITDYIGAYRRIVVNNAFTTALSNTSTYEIRPSVDIDGDGTGAAARCLIETGSSNSVSAVEILSRGSGYSYATLTVRANTGGISNAAVLVPVIAPPGGHGSNAALELGATAVGISVKFANNESNNIPTTNDYRTIGVLRDPLFANVHLTLTNISGVFTVGDTVTQVNSNAMGTITSFEGSSLYLTNVRGEIVQGQTVYQSNGVANVATANVSLYEINNVVKNFDTFDQRFKYSVNYISGTFQADEAVYQNNIFLANGVYHSNDATFFTMTNVKGVINAEEEVVGVTSVARANVTGRVEPDLVKYSGDVIFLEYIDPVTRSNTQSEQIKIVLKF